MNINDIVYETDVNQIFDERFEYTPTCPTDIMAREISTMARDILINRSKWQKMSG